MSKRLSKEAELIINTTKKLMKKNKQFPSLEELQDYRPDSSSHWNPISRYKIRKHFGGMSGLRDKIASHYPEFYSEFLRTMNTQSTIDVLTSYYVDLCVDLDRYPTRIEFLNYIHNYGYTRWHFESTVKSIMTLMEKAKATHPTVFKEILFSSDTFTQSRWNDHKKLISKHNKFLYITAVSGCKVIEENLNAIRTWENSENGLLLISPQADPARPRQGQEMYFDRSLRDDVFIYEDLWLNKNVLLSDILTSAKQINPQTGLKRLGKREGVVFYAGTKLSLEPIANNHLQPKFSCTPGALTVADYNTEMYMSNRTAKIATEDHTQAGWVIDILDYDRYLLRPITFINGSFVDLGWKYSSDGSVEFIGSTDLILPDLHENERDMEAFAVWQQIASVLRPKRKYIHDGFNGTSCNHHDKNKHLTNAITHIQEPDFLDVEREGEGYVNMLHELSDDGSELIIVKSNHDERLDNVLEEGEYPKDKVNSYIMHKIAMAILEGAKNNITVDPLETLAKLKGLDPNRKIKFLQQDESHISEGFENGYHGHRGPDGKRWAKLEDHDETLGPSNTAHTHKSRICRRAWSVGTGTGIAKPTDTSGKAKRPKYAKGTSSWSQSLIITYPGGFRQLVPIFGSTWCANLEAITPED